MYDGVKRFGPFCCLAVKSGAARPSCAAAPSLWQPTQYLSNTGCTSRLKLKPRAGPYQGVMSEGWRWPAIVGRIGGVRILRIVAAHAGEPLARHGRVPASHELQGLAFGIERLHGDGRVGGNLETRRAVGLDRHRAEDAMHVPGAVDADMDMSAHARISEVRLVEPQLLDRAARHALQPRPAVNVGQKTVASFFARSMRSGIAGGRATFRSGIGFEEDVALLFLNERHVVEHIDEVNAPFRLRRRLAGCQEVLVAQRIGMQEPRPRAFHQAVAR